jgi:hypothetical protein
LFRIRSAELRRRIRFCWRARLPSRRRARHAATTLGPCVVRSGPDRGVEVMFRGRTSIGPTGGPPGAQCTSVECMCSRRTGTLSFESAIRTMRSMSRGEAARLSERSSSVASSPPPCRPSCRRRRLTSGVGVRVGREPSGAGNWSEPMASSIPRTDQRPNGGYSASDPIPIDVAARFQAARRVRGPGPFESQVAFACPSPVSGVRIRNGRVRSRSVRPNAPSHYHWDELPSPCDERTMMADGTPDSAVRPLVTVPVPSRAGDWMSLTRKTKPSFHTSNVSKWPGTPARPLSCGNRGHETTCRPAAGHQRSRH